MKSYSKRQVVFSVVMGAGTLLYFGVILCCAFLLAGGSVAVAQDQPGNPAYDWLNGKWRGPGSRELDLKVVNGNQVTGTVTDQIMTGGGRKLSHSPIAGAVDGDAVELTLLYQGRQVKFRLSHVEGTLKGKSKGEEVVYKKME
jgi:hypothetical protein